MKDYVKDVMLLIGSEDNKKIQHKMAEILDSLHKEIKIHSEQIKEIEKQLALIHSLSERYVHEGKSMAQEAQVKSQQELVTRDERRNLIRDIALELVKEGNKVITVDLMIRTISNRGIDLKIQRVGSAIGTILSGMPEFKRIRMGSFEYIDDTQFRKK